MDQVTGCQIKSSKYLLTFKIRPSLKPLQTFDLLFLRMYFDMDYLGYFVASCIRAVQSSVHNGCGFFITRSVNYRFDIKEVKVGKYSIMSNAKHD